MIRAGVLKFLAALAVCGGLPSSDALSERANLSSRGAVEITAGPAVRPPEGARYRIDASQSRFIVRAFAGGLLSGFAHDHTIAIRSFTGEAAFTYVTVSPASLQMTIKADSLAVTDKVSDSDRQKIQATMRDEVLEVDKYPEIVLKSTNVVATRTGEGHYDATITGDLTLHGVTRGVSIPAKLVFNADNMRARGEFSLRQTSYGIKPVSIAAGTIKVKDEVKFSFEIVAHQ
ncbi:MAG: YceI family protein [Blastocatellia bacterium]